MATSASLIIIGGGVCGLSAGCYAAMNNYKTTLFEMAATPGGLCTSWKRNGYQFDGSVAGVAGSAPGTSLFRLWQEIGVEKYCPFYYGENFGHIRLADGRVITVYVNAERLESHLLENFPVDEKPIREFIRALRQLLDLEIPFSATDSWQAAAYWFKTFINSVIHLPVMLKYGTMTIRQFSAKFRDPMLVTAFNNFVHFGGPDVPLLTMLLPLAYAHRKMAGIPRNGWLSFARAIERRFVELGGKPVYGAPVERLLIENSAVRGVKLRDGSEHYADRVLTTADGRFSQSLLLGKPEGQSTDVFHPEQISDQPVQVNVGVSLDFSHIDGPMTILLPGAQNIAGRRLERLTIHNKCFDPDAAPEGKSALTVFLDSDYVWWSRLGYGSELYRSEKQYCADFVIDCLEQFHPGFKKAVEVIDVATPLTRERYTGNWLGAMQARKPDRNLIRALLAGTPRYAHRGIKGFYSAGQWVEPWGGIPTAAQSGRNAVRMLCKDDHRQFTTSNNRT